MKLLVISFVCNIRSENLTDPGRDSMICFVSVGLFDSDVVDNDPNERVCCIRSTTDVDVVAWQLDEVHNHIERWQSAVGIHCSNVSGHGLFRGVILERADGVVDQPERHNDIVLECCLNRASCKCAMRSLPQKWELMCVVV